MRPYRIYWSRFDRMQTNTTLRSAHQRHAVQCKMAALILIGHRKKGSHEGNSKIFEVSRLFKSSNRAELLHMNSSPETKKGKNVCLVQNTQQNRANCVYRQNVGFGKTKKTKIWTLGRQNRPKVGIGHIKLTEI